MNDRNHQPFANNSDVIDLTMDDDDSISPITGDINTPAKATVAAAKVTPMANPVRIKIEGEKKSPPAEKPEVATSAPKEDFDEDDYGKKPAATVTFANDTSIPKEDAAVPNPADATQAAERDTAQKRKSSNNLVVVPVKKKAHVPNVVTLPPSLAKGKWVEFFRKKQVEHGQIPAPKETVDPNSRAGKAAARRELKESERKLELRNRTAECFYRCKYRL